MPSISPGDREWLQSRYKRLLVTEYDNKLLLRGVFDLHAEYKDIVIDDAYVVRFDIPLAGGRPKLEVTDGRLIKVMAHKGLRAKSELHMYTDGYLCTITPQEWDLEFDGNVNVRHFLMEYVEPYFYAQSYFESKGEWPWKHYAHNAPGLVQWYLEKWKLDGAAKATALELANLLGKDDYAVDLAARAVKEGGFSFWHDCLCGSGKGYIDCHPLLANLAQELRYIIGFSTATQ